MRTVCDVCAAAPARYFCAADEAALCAKCDEKVHGCNKLASRHVRLELAEARKVPRCDICGINSAYFFCGIDGTSLCLQCDMDVHVGGKRMHDRYLLLGQRVKLPAVSLKEEVTLLNKAECVQDQQKRHAACVSHHCPHLHQQHSFKGNPKYSDDQNDSNAPAVAVAVGEAKLTSSQPIDLNNGPTNTESQRVQSGEDFLGGGTSQDEEDDELFTSSDDECVGVVPELSSKDRDF